MELVTRTGEPHVQGHDPTGALPPFGGNEIGLLLGDPQKPSLVGSTDTRKGEKAEEKCRGCAFPRRLFVLFGFNCTPEPLVFTTPSEGGPGNGRAGGGGRSGAGGQRGAVCGDNLVIYRNLGIMMDIT